MKLLTKQVLGATTALVFAAIGLVIAAVVWLAATPHGTRWLLETAIPLSGIGFSAKKIEGKIIDHLLLTGVRVTLAQQKVEIDTLELRWKPLLLLSGTIAVQELSVNGVRIQDDAPPDNKPPVLVWPKVSVNSQLFEGRIVRGRMANISYRSMQNQPLQVTHIDGSATWQDGLLSITELKASAPAGRIEGSISAGFAEPSLTADLAIDLAQPIAKMNQFKLQMRQSRGNDPEPFAGTVMIAGSVGNRKLLELSGDMGMARNAVNLRRLRLTRPGQKGVVTAEGALAFTSLESVVSLQVKVSGLDLDHELNIPTDLSGSLIFAGTPDRYRGEFTLANKAEGWQAAVVSAAYQGTREGMKLAPLNAKVLDGSLVGNLDINWRSGFDLQGTINGRNLNPARFDPDWKGVANFSVSGKMAFSGKEPLTGSISGVLLESRLHGQALTGRLQANFTGDNIIVAGMELHGKGFDLDASGDLKRRLVMSARITNTSLLVPGTTGTFQADGWVRRRNGDFSGAVSGTGNKLSFAGIQISSANLTARLDEGEGYPVHATASLRNVVSDGYTLDSMTVAIDGTLQRHTMNATLASGGSKVQMNLSAGYDDVIWRGMISRLSGSDSKGPWKLTAPATFAVSAERIFISPLALAAGATERLEVSADLELNPPKGKVLAKLINIDLMRLKPLLPPETGIEGHISGRADGILMPGQRFRLGGNAVLSKGALHHKSGTNELDLTFTSAEVSLGWQEETLSGTISMAMTEHGQARAHFQIPLPARFPVAVNSKGALKGALTGRFQEKGFISGMFPELIQKSFGDFDADLTVGGTWEAPQLGGTVRLAKGSAYLPTTGIHLKDIQLAAYLENNLILVDSFRALSGPGHIEGTARFTLGDGKGISYHGVIRGKNFQTVHLPELRIQSSPELTFEGTPQKLSLRGELHIPELNFVGAQSRAVITPSRDVIREGRVAPPPAGSPLALDVKVRVMIGEQVFVKVAGIDARLGGAVDLSLTNLDRIISKGEIKVIKGRYRTYGVNLEIIRGRLFFAGGPINNPSIDILALRRIGNVQAGVTVAGTLRRPSTTLYSEPAMPDVDILAYIVLGHPLGSSGEQASLVNQAAGALLTSGQAEVLQNQIKSRFGLSTLEIQEGVGGTSGSMGYKPLQVTAPGAIPTTQQPGITETMLTVGKYLTPKFYISYGRSLFTGSNLFLMRYDFFKKWQIETQTGAESSVDLFYKLEFK